MMTIRLVSLEIPIKRMLLDTGYIAWEKDSKGKTRETENQVSCPTIIQPSTATLLVPAPSS